MLLAGVCKRDDFSSVNEYCCCNDDGFAGTNDDYGWRSGVDDDGSVFADVQGC